METHNTALTIIRAINLILITIAVSGFVLNYIKYKYIGVLAPVSWLIHVFVYGLYRFMTPETLVNQMFMQTWTAFVIMHGIILCLVMAILSFKLPDHRMKGP